MSPSKNRRVSFGAVQVREYQPIAGYDYPDWRRRTTKMAHYPDSSTPRRNNKSSSWVFLCLWVMLFGLLKLEQEDHSLRKVRLASALSELAERNSTIATTGQKRRVFDGPTLCSWWQLQARSSYAEPTRDPNRHCALWAVVSTIQKQPTNAIRQVAKRTTTEEEWCMVVVGQEQTPEEPYQVMANHSHHKIVYLSSNYQPLPYLATDGLARKNLGYLYAIAHGAQAIYDFEDDAVLKDDNVVPFPWQDGRPDKAREETPNVEAETSTASLPKKESIGVVPSPCNGKASPPGATVHTRDAFWGLLLLPSTAEESDIWRVYFAQRLRKDLQLASMVPCDGQAMQHNHNSTSALVRFLDEEWKEEEEINNQHLPSRIEKLWIALYEHGYVGREDVQAMQQWLLALSDVGYAFPELPSGGNTTTSDLPVVEEHASMLRGQSSTSQLT